MGANTKIDVVLRGGGEIVLNDAYQFNTFRKAHSGDELITSLD